MFAFYVSCGFDFFHSYLTRYFTPHNKGIFKINSTKDIKTLMQAGFFQVRIFMSVNEFMKKHNPKKITMNYNNGCN